MKAPDFHRSPAAFALVLTLTLLALVVLVTLSLAALLKVDGQMAATATFQAQARQNASLALGVALGELQRHAGDDSRITGMAGIAHVPFSGTATTRYWCGVWNADGSFMAWLTSGAGSQPIAGPDTVELISTGSVGPANSSTGTPNVEKVHVVANKVLIPTASETGHAGPPARGKYAYLVTDEGVKIGAYAENPRASGDTIPLIGATMLADQVKLRAALQANAGLLPLLRTYEQLDLLPGDVSRGVLQDCFHYVSLAPRFVVGGQYRAGMINLNTCSPLVWRSLLDTYNAMPGVVPVTPASAVTSRGNLIGNNFAATTAGKNAHGPFLSVAGFADYLATVFPSPASPNSAEIMAALGPMLTTRSDTFRIRAYGEALNPLDPARTEAGACCEAIVQRTPDPLPGFGRRFVIVSFRWLGPEDI